MNHITLLKRKTRKKSLDEIVDLLKEKIVNPENQTIYVAHADCDNKEVDYKNPQEAVGGHYYEKT